MCAVSKMDDNNDNRLQHLSRHLREASTIISTFLQPSNGSNASPNPNSTASSASVASSRPATTSSQIPTSSTSGVGSVLNRARAMISSSVSNGSFSRLGSRERLRAMSTSRQSRSNPPQKKKKVEAKVYEFVLVDVRESEEMPWSLSEDKVLLRGIVEINSNSKEADIREELGKAMRIKYKNISNTDIEFLRATRRKLSKPVNCGDFNFKEVKLIVGQGSLYVKLKDWIYCLIGEESNNSDDETGKENHIFLLLGYFTPCFHKMFIEKEHLINALYRCDY